MFVLGIPGPGKSVTTRRDPQTLFAEQGAVPALGAGLPRRHGRSSGRRGRCARRVRRAPGPLPVRAPRRRPHPMPEAAWELSEVIGYVCGLGARSRERRLRGRPRPLQRARFRAAGGPTGLPKHGRARRSCRGAGGWGRGANVAARLRPLTDFGLFVTAPGDAGFAELLTRGRGARRPRADGTGAARGGCVRRCARCTARCSSGADDGAAVGGGARRGSPAGPRRHSAEDHEGRPQVRRGRWRSRARASTTSTATSGQRGTKVAFRCNFPQSRKVAGFLRGRARVRTCRRRLRISRWGRRTSPRRNTRRREKYSCLATDCERCTCLQPFPRR